MDPNPTATNLDPPIVIECPTLPKNGVEAEYVHNVFVPVVEKATTFAAAPPSPTATNRVPVQTIPLAAVLNVVVPKPVQLIPSFEYARVLVPCPTATHRDNVGLHAAPLPDTVNMVAPKPTQLIPS